MKRTLRFMVAKYTPDLHRMEPRNVGLILWADSGTAVARFVGEYGKNEFRIPALIERQDRHAYREWITYWRHQLASEGIKRRSGEFVPRSSAAFLEALLEKSKEQFRLVDGGTFTEQIAEREIDGALSELYSRIVERPEAQLVRAELLELSDSCKRLFETTGISEREDLRHDLEVPRHVHGVLRTFIADFALGPIGHPVAIMQRVLLTRAQSIDSNAFMFDALLRDSKRPMQKDNCAALVHGGHAVDKSAREGRKLLEAIVPVIDVSKSQALKEIEAISARSNGHH